MGLLSKLKEVAHTISDMGQITNLQNQVTEGVEKLHDEGNCPDEVWNAYGQFQSAGEAVKAEKDNAKASKMSIAALHAFLATLEEHEDKLPDSFKEKIEKFAKVEKEVESLTEKIMK